MCSLPSRITFRISLSYTQTSQTNPLVLHHFIPKSHIAYYLIPSELSHIISHSPAVRGTARGPLQFGVGVSAPSGGPFHEPPVSATEEIRRSGASRTGSRPSARFVPWRGVWRGGGGVLAQLWRWWCRLLVGVFVEVVLLVLLVRRWGICI